MTHDYRPSDLEVANCDDWTRIALHCKECGVQFFRKVKGQRYCDEHRNLAGAVVKPVEHPSSNPKGWWHAYYVCSDGIERAAVSAETLDGFIRTLEEGGKESALEAERLAAETVRRPSGRNRVCRGGNHGM